MIVIKGTEKIKKGIVNLDSIKIQIKQDEQFPVSEADFYNSDVQMALRMGLISQDGEAPDPINEPDENVRKVICKSMHPREMTFSFLDRPIQPNQEFTLEEDQLKNPHMQTAISKGMVKVVETVESTGYTEAFLELNKAFQQASSDREKARAEIDDVVESIDSEELETNEEITGPTQVIDEEDPKPIKKKDIPDAKRSSVTWNPTRKQPYNKMDNVKSVTKRSGSKKASADNTDSNPTFVDAEEDIDQILFADRELEKERVDSHPKLKGEDIEQNSEIDFVDG